MQEKRLRVGEQCSVVGILLNCLLFCFKCAVGVLSGAQSIIADAFNNLSDAAASFITLLGFRLAAREADEEHPFGHGRAEYIAALTVSILIIVMGVELLLSAVGSFATPQAIDISSSGFVVLIGAACVKLAMMSYNRILGIRYDSQALLAASADSFGDAIATLAVICSVTAYKYYGLNVDSILAALVAASIIRLGIKSTSEAISPLLGKPAGAAVASRVSSIVGQYPEVIGIHDFIAHDYGPGKNFLTFHAEVDAKSSFVLIHDVIDNLEAEIGRALDCLCVIHMDPVETDNAEVSRMKAYVLSRLRAWDERISVHDFRMVAGPSHTNLVFDIVVPYSVKMKPSQIKERAEELINSGPAGGVYRLVINVDRSYVEDSQ